MPPSVSRSVASRVTPSASRAASTVLTSSCSAVGQGVRALLCEEGVGAGEPDEGDGGDAVLGVRWPGREELAEGGREEGRQPVPRRAGARMPGEPGAVCGAPASQQQGAVVARRGSRRGPAGVAVAGLTTTCPASAAFSASATALAPGPSTSSSRVGDADEEELDVAGVHAHRHRQREAARRRRHGGGRAQRGAHLDGCVAGLFGVVVAAEEEEQRVAAELQQLAAAGRRDGEHRPEHPVERLDDLLGADPAVPGQPLGERGEARDVGEDQRAVDRAVQRPGGLVVPAPASAEGRADAGRSSVVLQLAGPRAGCTRNR